MVDLTEEIEHLAEQLHDVECCGGRCGSMDRRSCWKWTSGIFHRAVEHQVLLARSA